MLTSLIELTFGLLCLGTAGAIVIRLWDKQRQAGQKDE